MILITAIQESDPVYHITWFPYQLCVHGGSNFQYMNALGGSLFSQIFRASICKISIQASWYTCKVEFCPPNNQAPSQSPWAPVKVLYMKHFIKVPKKLENCYSAERNGPGASLLNIFLWMQLRNDIIKRPIVDTQTYMDRYFYTCTEQTKLFDDQLLLPCS